LPSVSEKIGAVLLFGIKKLLLANAMLATLG
jgi:hypothetical protein